MKLRAVSRIKRAYIVVLLILLVLTIYVPISVVSQVPPIVPCPSGTFEKYGPRVSDLVFEPWYDVISEADALAAGDIDVMDWSVPDSYVAAWMADPEITLGDYSEWGWYEYDINNAQWPTGHGEMTPPGWTGSEPAVTTGHYWQNYTEDGADFCQRCYDSRQFRRALAHLANRTAMVANMGGFAEPMETFIFPDIAEWENPSAPKYAYSLVLAEAALIEGGFQDWDGNLTNGIEYSPSHGAVPGDEEELPVLRGWINSDDPDITFTGIQLRDDLLELGVPLIFAITDRSTCYYHARVVYDYHVYTGGWSWGPRPDMYSELWHSSKDTYPWSHADNYNRYHNEEYDELALGLKTAPTAAAAKLFVDQCQMMLHRDAACIPLYAHIGYVAHRTDYTGVGVYTGHNWTGFVNELGVGFSNFWTHLNAHPESFEKGGWLTQGMIDGVGFLSPVHAYEPCAWLVLSRIYEPLIKNHPYNVTEKIPWLCSNWTVGTWEFEGENCTKITFDLRFKSEPFLDYYPIFWHDGTLLTPEDVGFSFTYMRDEKSVANYWAVTNYHDYITAANGSGWWGDPLPPDTIDILYNAQSWLALDWAAGVPIIPKHIWEGQDSWTWDPEDHDAVIGTGPFMCNKTGVVGRVDRVPGGGVHLEANPPISPHAYFYHREYIWPDVCEDTHTPGVTDGWVDIDDYMEVSLPGHMFTYDLRLYPPWFPPWDPVWGPICDVNKDGCIDVGDLLDLGLRFFEMWPPPWYVDCPHACIDMRTASVETLSVPVVYVDPEISHCRVGSNFTININVANLTMEHVPYGTYGWQFFMSFNPSLIEVVNITLGGWLAGTGDAVLDAYTRAGVVALYELFRFPWPETGVSGSGTLANVTFQVLAEGKCPLHLYMNKLRTYNGTKVLVVDHTAVDGIFTIAGDANGDGDVDAYDLSTFSKAYGSELGDPNWNSSCDFNRDDKADASDLFDLCENYGKTV